jgi:glycosyltransferase involved in cell wall biosynthesis
VAIVGADFSPSSLPPALRIRLFAQHLPEFGWEPVVITTDPKYYDWPVDPENEQLLPDSLKIIRTGALPSRVTRKIGFSDIGIRSLWHHWCALRQLCRSGDIDLIFLPVPPNYGMALGRVVWARFRIPYVVDYIDPVVTEYYWNVPKVQRPPKWQLVYRFNRLLEAFALRKVAHLTAVDRSYTCDVFKRCPWLCDNDTTGIPYGGEATDFEYARTHLRPNKIFDSHDGLQHVSYVGRGGPDMIPSLQAVFQALKLGIERSPGLFSRIRMHFVGTTYAPRAEDLYQVLPLAREAGVEDLVDEHPSRVSYLDAIQILLDSHALLVVGSESPHYTASKIFPYVLSRRPLLAIFHRESSVVQILRETCAGDVVQFSGESPPAGKVQEITTALEKLLALPREYSPPTCWGAFERYTARAMAAELAGVFDHVIDARSKNSAKGND